jgi:uncharacterized protein with ParB-like and HNH nuclease domain
MLKDAHQYQISQIFDIDKPVIYTIPKYQREYTWNKGQWDDLFDDLDENANGYYLGSIICLNNSTDILSIQELEVIDGQQRLTTIMLLFAAIYNTLNQFKNKLDDDQKFELLNLRNKIVLKFDKKTIRLRLQDQNKNNDDFIGVLKKIGVSNNGSEPKYAGNRRIYHAYEHFKSRIEKLLEEKNSPVESLINYLQKITAACVVKIEVESYADAFIMFESLNNRGIALSSVDLIKNTLLASLDRNNPDLIDEYYNKWQELLDCLGDDYSAQERFFRYYYDAFHEELKEIHFESVATRTNLIKIYEALIKSDTSSFIKNILISAQKYSHILNRSQDETLKRLNPWFLKLYNIQGAPSYLLLLYLLVKMDILEITEDHIIETVRILICFFVRRNITDIPPTRDLVRIFMSIVSRAKDLKGDAIPNLIKDELKSKVCSDAEFEDKLKNPLYEDNKDATRFILCSLAEKNMTKETWTDLWFVNNKQYVWTIEHIFPEGENIPQPWIDMMGDGDKVLAKEIQQSHVHKIGNLTISGYNSSLGTKIFSDKKERKNADGKYVGYKNGLSLNQDLLETDVWTKELIDRRTVKLANEVLELFTF